MPSTAPASPPTARVIDVLELLCREGAPPKLSDVVRHLDLTQGTAHAIMDTLCERGWVVRDPEDRTYSAGPALEIAASRLARARTIPHEAIAVARDLSQSTGFATSVTERLGDVVIVTALEGGPDWLHHDRPADKVPFAAPFGPAFAAFEDGPERQAWIERGGVTDRVLAGRLATLLDEVRVRGYTIERNTPSMARAAQLMDGLHDDAASEPIRDMVGALLVEITKLSFAPAEDDKDARDQQISSLAAPVYDGRGRVACNLSIHPFVPLGPKKVADLGRLLTAASAAITSATTLEAS